MTPKKILWVDDAFVNELHDVMVYEDELIYQGGFDIVKIAHPDRALDILEKGVEEFVCIILDIMMPYGNGERFKRGETQDGTQTGIVLAKRIQQMEKYKNVPIVLLTGVRYIFDKLVKDPNGFPCFFKAGISAEQFLEDIKRLVGTNYE